MVMIREVTDFQRERALLEYSDRVIFPKVASMLESHGKQHRSLSNSMLSGLFQRARGVQKSDDLFEKDGCDHSFESFLSDRILLSERRGHTGEESFYSEVARTIFGNEETTIRRAASGILNELFFKKEDITAQERERSQLFLFHEWIKHIYLKAKYLGQSRR